MKSYDDLKGPGATTLEVCDFDGKVILRFPRAVEHAVLDPASAVQIAEAMIEAAKACGYGKSLVLAAGQRLFLVTTERGLLLFTGALWTMWDTAIANKVVEKNILKRLLERRLACTALVIHPRQPWSKAVDGPLEGYGHHPESGWVVRYEATVVPIEVTGSAHVDG